MINWPASSRQAVTQNLRDMLGGKATRHPTPGPVHHQIKTCLCLQSALETSDSMKPRSIVMKLKMPTFSQLCQFRLCNLIPAMLPKKPGTYCENVNVRTMDSDQTHKQKASLSKAFTSCQCFKLYTISTVRKWQTVAARLSVQNIRQHKPQPGAKYSYRTGLFHRLQPSNKISNILGRDPIFGWNQAWRSPMCFSRQMKGC